MLLHRGSRRVEKRGEGGGRGRKKKKKRTLLTPRLVRRSSTVCPDTPRRSCRPGCRRRCETWPRWPGNCRAARATGMARSGWAQRQLCASRSRSTTISPFQLHPRRSSRSTKTTAPAPNGRTPSSPETWSSLRLYPLHQSVPAIWTSSVTIIYFVLRVNVTFNNIANKTR